MKVSTAYHYILTLALAGAVSTAPLIKAHPHEIRLRALIAHLLDNTAMKRDEYLTWREEFYPLLMNTPCGLTARYWTIVKNTVKKMDLMYATIAQETDLSSTDSSSLNVR
jgi:hypothetical protein